MPSSLRVDASGTLHATAVARGQTGLLLTGPAGSGKSDLALRLLACGWRLIGDDRVQLSMKGRGLTVTSVRDASGRIEVRGLGIVTLPAAIVAESAIIAGTVALLPAPNQVERMPGDKFQNLLGIEVPVLELCPFEPSAPLKLSLFLDRLTGQEVSLGPGT